MPHEHHWGPARPGERNPDIAMCARARCMTILRHAAISVHILCCISWRLCVRRTRSKVARLTEAKVNGAGAAAATATAAAAAGAANAFVLWVAA